MIEESLKPTERRFDAVVFDLDGTLVDTAPDILAYLNDMLDELGRPGLDLETMRPMIGDGVRRLLIRGLEASGGVPDDLDIEALFHRYLERYAAEPVRSSQPYEGVVETLEILMEAGIKLGVCTNKPQVPTDRLLARLGLDRFFGIVIGGDALSIKKPDPAHLLAVLERLNVAPVRAALVGDSETDLKTARSAGTLCILVTFGYTAIPASDLGADQIIDHYQNLIPTLTRHHRLTATKPAPYSLPNKGD
ncbi:MAG: phosphoglycolate phosphatase [Geminicoccaceae bacterium]